MADVIGPDGLPLPGASGILNPNTPGVGYFFGNTGTPSYEELKRRREIAMRSGSQLRPFPKTLGEGIASLGEAFGQRMEGNRLNEAERALDAKNTAQVNRIGGMTGAPAPAPGRTSEVADPSTTRNNIAALLTPGGGQGNPTEAGVTPPTTDTLEPPTSTAGGPSDNAAWSARANAIGGIESGGRYDSISKAPTKYGHALGKYGVVEANVAPWTQAALGQPMTAQQFLANPQAQDAVFKHRFGQYVDKFGEEGAARAWFGGPGNVNNTNATDAYQRINIGQYGQDYLNRLRGAQRGAPTSALASSSGTMSDAPALGVPGEGAPASAIEAGSDTDANPPTPTSIRPMRTADAAGARGTTVGPAPATIPAASTPEDEYLMPKPVPPALPERTPEHPQETAARRALSAMSADPDNPQRRILANMVKEHEDKRAFQDAREVARYNSQMQHFNAQDTAYQAQQSGLAKQRDEARQRRFQQTEAEKTAALQDRLGGRKVEDFVKDFKTEQGEANKQIGALNGIQEAEAAIKAGAITGAGRGFRLNAERAKALFGGANADQIAAQSQILDSTLKSTLSVALAKYQAGDNRVTEGDLRAAQGMIGTPDMQRDAILKLTAIAKQEAYDRINAFEERRHQKVGGTPLEGDFALTMRPVTSPEKLKILLDHKDDPNTVAHFDKTFGPGAARLEIDRARRTDEAARRAR